MIVSFRSKPLQAFVRKGLARKLPVPDTRRLERQLAVLNSATRPDDLDLPGFHFHPLQGNPKRYSVRVTGNYRLTFGWSDGDAVDVDLEDYH